MVLTKTDLAKYPFLKQAADYIRRLDIKIEDLTEPENPIVLRAEQRLQEAILFANITNLSHNEEIEIPSFPLAILLAAATKDSFIKRRYSLAEAKRTYNLLKTEPAKKLLEISQQFNWKLSITNTSESFHGFTLHFTDYLRNTSRLRDKKWKLVNRLLVKGNVYLTKPEVARLLAEEVHSYIQKRVEIKEIPELPENMNQIVEKLVQLATESRGKTKLAEFPRSIIIDAFPPCIKTLYRRALSGSHLSHIGRFTLTSFLVNVGMPTENVIDIFRNTSDFNERMTRYQVEHIAGERGSRTRYIPPKCETLKTHGVCITPDDLCSQIQHPLAYYRRKYKSGIQRKENRNKTA